MSDNVTPFAKRPPKQQMVVDATLDICACGDYRSDHEDNDGPCRLRGGPHAGIRCNAFKFSHVSSQAEIARHHKLMASLENHK